MISRLEKFRKRRYTTTVRFSALWIAIIFSMFYDISWQLSSSGGTFAWFTSQTEASGSIQNARTNDLLDIQASEIHYGKNCTLGNSLSITNISQQDTTVTVILITEKGDKILAEKHLNPGEFLTTHLNESNNLTQKCKTDKIGYRIQAFSNFVNESYTVAVDKNKLLASIENVKNDQGGNGEDKENSEKNENNNDTESNKARDSKGNNDIEKNSLPEMEKTINTQPISPSAVNESEDVNPVPDSSDVKKNTVPDNTFVISENQNYQLSSSP